MIEIILHIGPPKTGTTTIQQFLCSAQSEMVRDGVLYPLSGRLKTGKRYRVLRGGKNYKLIKGPSTAHHLLPWTLDNQVRDLNAEECWNTVISEITSEKARKVIISSEDFAWLTEKKLMRLKRILSGYRVIIYIYYRNPLKWMLSRYNQNVKVGRYKYSFKRFINEGMPYEFISYGKLIGRYTRCFGEENVKLKYFDAIVDNDGLEKEIADSLGIGTKKYVKFIKKMPKNISLSDEKIKMVRIVNIFEDLFGPRNGLKKICSKARRSIITNGRAYRLVRSFYTKIDRRPVCRDKDVDLLRRQTIAWHRPGKSEIIKYIEF